MVRMNGTVRVTAFSPRVLCGCGPGILLSRLWPLGLRHHPFCGSSRPRYCLTFRCISSWVQRKEKDCASSIPQDDEYNSLFLTSNGKPITSNTIKLLFHRLAKASGLGRLHAHLCRHTFAVNYIMNGGDISSLKEILGHTTFEMVNHYLHFTKSQITAQHRKYSPMDRLHFHK